MAVLSCGSTLFQRVQDGLHVAHLAAGRQALAPAVIEDIQGDAVALMNDQVGKRGRQQLGVFELVRVAVAIEHRPAGVEQDMADKIRFLLVLLDGVAFGRPYPFQSI